MRTESLFGQVLRGLLLFGASTFAYLALRELPILQVYVINFSSPLLGERVMPARGLAVATGFVGVLSAVIPVDWRAQPAVLLPFGMACCFALYLQIVWATASGYLVFGDVPSPATYLGAGLIIAAGLYLATRRS